MKKIPLIIGPVLFILTVLLDAPGTMEPTAWKVAGIAAWMATWWLTSVIALEATALLPLVLIPFAGVSAIRDAAEPYADPIIFLFLGGFLLAATLERWDLHRRFAIATVRVAGTDGPRVVLAFMLASAILSMWISNTATAVMMLPIAKAVAGDPNAEGNRGYAMALLLGVAYACSIGGLSTLIGTPPNAIFAGSVTEFLGRDVGFGSWMITGLSVSIPMFIACWFLLVKLFKVPREVPGLVESVGRESSQFGKMSGAERYIVGVFVMTALAWILRAPKDLGGLRIPGLVDFIPQISDAGIAIAAALVMFATPFKSARFSSPLDWNTARKVPWGILLLFGGGLALARAFVESGLTTWIGQTLQGLQGLPLPVVVLITTTLFVYLTEMTSNAATTAIGMPLMFGVAQGLNLPPYPLMVAATLAASMAFMLPVATPPNAIVFGSGMLPPSAMAKAGGYLNVVAILVITVVVSLFVS
jgi:sodium-dependent dicarboxylate transporter 2/3/5